MWQCKYAKESFDLRLFVLKCIGEIRWILVGLVCGALCIGGFYYLKNVTFYGKVPYMVTQKLDVQYAEEPKSNELYSYYTAYTWNDWVKSDYFTEGLLERLPEGLTKEEVIKYYEMSMPSDLELIYITVTHEEREMTQLLADSLAEELAVFGEKNKELDSISVIDYIGPKPVVRDVRTARAVILGAVLGTFFALFAIAFRMILDEGIYLPETVSFRYQIPAVGFVDTEGQCSSETAVSIGHMFRGMDSVGITAVEPDADLTAAVGFFEKNKAVCIPSVLQVPESLELLRNREGNLLLVRAGIANGKAVETVLHQCRVNDVKITAVLLADADRKLIDRYRFGRKDAAV